MRVTEDVVNVTKEVAADFLSKSAGNRRVSPSHVKMLATRMRRGVWNTNAKTSDPLMFDEEGRFTSGHHRMHAVILAGSAVPFRVVRGVPREVTHISDTGQKQWSLNDAVSQAEPRNRSVSVRVAALRVCVNLLVGNHVTIRSYDEYVAWMELFRKGIDWVVAALAGTSGPKAIKNATVYGALAFAHAASPGVVEKFGRQLRDGTGLGNTDPVGVLRNFLLGGDGSRAASGGWGERLLVRQKVLSCILATIQGQKMTRVTRSAEAVRVFVDAYDEDKVDKVISKMLPFDEEPKVVPPAKQNGR